MVWNIELVRRSDLDRIAVCNTTLPAELDQLSKVNGLRMPEVVAFYAGRIVEGLASQAIKKFQIPLENDVNLKDKIELLYLWGRIDDGARSAANAIRRLSNQARHVERTLNTDEEDTVLGLLQLWVEWASTHLVKGSQDGQTMPDWSGKSGLLRVFAQGQSEQIHATINASAGLLDSLLADAATGEFAAERLIDCDSPHAEIFTEKLLKLHKKNLRPVQLRALFYSRNGKPELATDTLKRVLYKPDAETLGIMGGAYKNLWLKTADANQLRRAYNHYTMGVDRFPDDYYLRINSAATAYWLGNSDEAKRHAMKSINILSNFGFKVGTGDDCSRITYWVIATLAEANLIAGHYDQSIYLYRQAKHMDATHGRWKRTAKQLSNHLAFAIDNKRFNQLPASPYFDCLMELTQ